MKRVPRKNKTGKVVVAVSGGFDPVHVGHIRYIQEAAKLGDELVVILNNDNWLIGKKGYAFMPEEERFEILTAIAGVDRVVLTDHKPGEYINDKSVCRALRKIRPDIFANGGDRKPDGDPVPEVAVCGELGIKMVYNIGKGGKVRSSSELLAEHAKRHQGATTEPAFKPRAGQLDYTNARFAPVVNCVLRHKGLILMIHRSAGLHFYPDTWNGVSGFLDDASDVEEKVYEELREEVGMKRGDVISVSKGAVFEVEEPKYKKTWIVHPVLVDVSTERVTLDREGQEYRWLKPSAARSLPLVPGVIRVFDALGL